MFGRFITLDDCTRNKERFDVGKVLIFATCSDIINKTVTVKINENFFKIRFMEDIFSSTVCKFKSEQGVSGSEKDGQSEDSDSEPEEVLQLPESEVSGDSQSKEVSRDGCWNPNSNSNSRVYRGKGTIDVNVQVSRKARMVSRNLCHPLCYAMLQKVKVPKKGG